jgi:hypothetical protein
MTYVIDFLHGEVRVANVMVCSISTNGWLPLNYLITNAFFPMSSDFGLGKVGAGNHNSWHRSFKGFKSKGLFRLVFWDMSARSGTVFGSFSEVVSFRGRPVRNF